MSTNLIAFIPEILQQYVDNATAIHANRCNLVTAPNAKLRDLRRFDDRVAANLDGLVIAGEQSEPFCDAALARLSSSAVFTATVVAIEGKSSERLHRFYALAEAVPEARKGVVAAFGWVEREALRGIVAGLLASSIVYLRFLGISACAVHRVNSAHAHDAALHGPSSELRTRALRACGEMGREELLPECLRLLHLDDRGTRFWAAWSAVLLGNRGIALTELRAFGEEPDSDFGATAFRLSLQALNQDQAQDWLSGLARNSENLGRLIQGCGIAGDPTYVPWLINQMAKRTTARLAGEAFSLITGVDLAGERLERKPQEGDGVGPNDDPSDPHVDMDPDDGLPWPDPERISDWWAVDGARFEPRTRYFMGAPVSREHCLKVLKEGFQRQRILAAHYLCLLDPGAPLFEWRAPAYRQQRLLAAMN